MTRDYNVLLCFIFGETYYKFQSSDFLIVLFLSKMAIFKTDCFGRSPYVSYGWLGVLSQGRSKVLKEVAKPKDITEVNLVLIQTFMMKLLC